MTSRYIDSHAHLFFDDYSEDLEDVLLRANKAGVGAIIVPGIDLKSSKEAVELANWYENIFACVGIHPHESAKTSEKDFKEIEELCRDTKVVAIGEIGLDYHYDFSPREIQRKCFSDQLEIAVRFNLPVVIHTRESIDDVISIVAEKVNANPDWKNSDKEPRRGVFHCFPGTAEQAVYLRRLGFYVSYPGIVTFKKSESTNIISQIGIQNILLETDSPYMTPVPFRGRRNEPANIVLIGRIIAEALNMSEEEIAHITTENAARLFGISLPGKV